MHRASLPFTKALPLVQFSTSQRDNTKYYKRDRLLLRVDLVNSCPGTAHHSADFIKRDIGVSMSMSSFCKVLHLLFCWCFLGAAPQSEKGRCGSERFLLYQGERKG